MPGAGGGILYGDNSIAAFQSWELVVERSSRTRIVKPSNRVIK